MTRMPSPFPDRAAIARAACAMLDPEAHAAVADYVRRARHAGGGFCDRKGEEDVYYTAFGLDAVLALGIRLDAPERLRAYLYAQADRSPGFVAAASVIRCLGALRRLGQEASGDRDYGLDLLGRMLAGQRADGGRPPEHPAVEPLTVYAVFLIAQAHADLGMAWTGAATALAGVDVRRAQDGGYANHPGRASGTTTATAAAALLFHHVGDDGRAREAAGWLARVRDGRGGYRTALATPTPDLLSTAVALYAERVCAAQALPPLGPQAAYIESLWEQGGFRGHAADATPDIEYTFYGLLALGALAGRDRGA